MPNFSRIVGVVFGNNQLLLPFPHENLLQKFDILIYIKKFKWLDFSNAPCDLTRKIATTRAVNFSTVNELNQLGKMDANFDQKWKFDFVVCTSMHQGGRPGGGRCPPRFWQIRRRRRCPAALLPAPPDFWPLLHPCNVSRLDSLDKWFN